MVKLDQSAFSIKLLTYHGTTFFTARYQVYPSKYVYRDDSVTRAESARANCTRYHEVYICCDGNQLKLSDSEGGPHMEYTANSYYVWTNDSVGKLLFVFPTRVSLTTITLHYYSDSDRGLPKLTFYAVPDDFEIWDTPSGRDPIVGSTSPQQGGEPVGMRNRNVTIKNANLHTKKVLMIKLRSKLQFAASEVDFFTSKH